jgi:hypothetical protein
MLFAMILVTKPSAVIFRGNMIKYCYNCPKCNEKLVKRAPVSHFIKKILFGLPLKKYICTRCSHEYYVYAAMHSIRPALYKDECQLDLPELRPEKLKELVSIETKLNNITNPVLLITI